MLKEKLKLSLRQLNLSRNVISKPICKICFEEFSPCSFALFNEHPSICNKCKKSFMRIDHSFTLEGVDIETIFEYKDPLSRYIFQYKESLDIELAPVFLEDLNLYYHFKYLFYHVVYMPSSEENYQRRGFNHLEFMFNGLHLPVIKDLLFKTDNIDQKNLNRKERLNHKNFIEIDKCIEIRGKNILLIDDVISTGNSLIQAIKVLKNASPRKIKILVLSENK